MVKRTYKKNFLLKNNSLEIKLNTIKQYFKNSRILRIFSILGQSFKMFPSNKEILMFFF
jgi:hypothetical protein